MESLENQTRRKSIRIDGIPEETNESWDDMKIERAHRTGKGNCRSSDDNASATRPRTIICRLVSWKQKDPILKATRIEKPEGMFVNEDLAAETLQRRLFSENTFKARICLKICRLVFQRLPIAADALPRNLQTSWQF